MAGGFGRRSTDVRAQDPAEAAAGGERGVERLNAPLAVAGGEPAARTPL